MMLQERQMWNKPCRYIEVGDIVLLKDVEEARQDENRLVCNVKVVVGHAHLDKRGQPVLE